MMIERMNFILETNDRVKVRKLMKNEPTYLEDMVGDHTISCYKCPETKVWSVYVTCDNLKDSLMALNNYLENWGKYINIMKMSENDLTQNELGVIFNDENDIKLNKEYLDCSKGTYKTFAFAKMVAYGMAAILNDKDWLDKNFEPEETFLEEL